MTATLLADHVSGEQNPAYRSTSRLFRRWVQQIGKPRTIKLDESTGKLDESTGKFDESTGKFDESTGKFDDSKGSSIAPRGRSQGAR